MAARAAEPLRLRADVCRRGLIRAVRAATLRRGGGWRLPAPRPAPASGPRRAGPSSGSQVPLEVGIEVLGPRGVRRLAAWETLLSVTTCDYHTGAMKAVGVKQLKARLSEYVRLVRAGATILVTDRDEVVAELRPARRQARPAADLDDLLDRLADAGEVTRASLPPEGWTWRVRGLGLPPGTAQTLLDELRADGATR